MFADLREKIDNEYLKFRCLTLASAREKIFNSSSEIEFKKEIRKYVEKKDWSLDEKKKLMKCENITENIYMICCDCGYSTRELDSAFIRLFLML